MLRPRAHHGAIAVVPCVWEITARSDLEALGLPRWHGDGVGPALEFVSELDFCCSRCAVYVCVVRGSLVLRPVPFDFSAPGESASPPAHLAPHTASWHCPGAVVGKIGPGGDSAGSPSRPRFVRTLKMITFTLAAKDRHRPGPGPPVQRGRDSLLWEIREHSMGPRRSLPSGNVRNHKKFRGVRFGSPG